MLVTQSCLTLWPVDCSHKASLSTWFPRQEYWSVLPSPSPGDLLDPGIEPGSPTLQADSLPPEPPGKSSNNSTYLQHRCLLRIKEEDVVYCKAGPWPRLGWGKWDAQGAKFKEVSKGSLKCRLPLSPHLGPDPNASYTGQARGHREGSWDTPRTHSEAHAEIIPVFVQLPMCVSVGRYMCKCVHIYIYIHTHTHIYVHL